MHPERPVLPAGKVIGPVYQRLSHQYPDVSMSIHIARIHEPHQYTYMPVSKCSVLDLCSSHINIDLPAGKVPEGRH